MYSCNALSQSVFGFFSATMTKDRREYESKERKRRNVRKMTMIRNEGAWVNAKRNAGRQTVKQGVDHALSKEYHEKDARKM